MKYKYKGMFCGIVPIRFNFDDDGLGIDIENNWYSPLWLLCLVSEIYDFIADCIGFEGGYRISNIRETK